MITRKFWPLDFDPEGAIYENPSWDLPGFRSAGRRAPLDRPHRTVRSSSSSQRRPRSKR